MLHCINEEVACWSRPASRVPAVQKRHLDQATSVFAGAELTGGAAGGFSTSFPAFPGTSRQAHPAASLRPVPGRSDPDQVQPPLHRLMISLGKVAQTPKYELSPRLLQGCRR